MIRKLKTWLTSISLICCSSLLYAQTYQVNKNTHSHNDYQQSQPFYTAYANRFASIEVDVFLVDNEFYVAHDKEDIDKRKTLESLYIEPILNQIKLNGGEKVYPDGGKLQLLIDLKTSGEPAMKRLEEKLKPVRKYFDLKANPNAVNLVISGNIPAPEKFTAYDDIFHFDGRKSVRYTAEQMKRIAFYSASFQEFSNWNGLGRMTHQDFSKVKKFVDSIHSVGRQVRFWGNPDTKTCWIAFMKLGVDFINTDSPAELAKFLNDYENNTYLANAKYIPYRPTYKSDVPNKKPKNVILLISDGAGFAQFWAAATANGGYLNATNFKHIGFSNTAPADDYNTDSAAGATAMATGEKTNNRFIGMDSTGKKSANLPEILSAKGIRSGIVSNDKVTGATPSSFFAHRTDRDQSDSISSDLQRSAASLIIGGYHEAFGKEQDRILNQVKASGFGIYNGLANLPSSFENKKVLCFDQDQPDKNFRLIEQAFDKSINFLSSNNDKGFFLMMEGAKIDAGGHANRIKQCIDEYLSFDKVIGKAMKFADENGETLVLVTSDHETGGLILFDGNYKTGSVTGTFTTIDHTGLPVPLFSYGPGSQNFSGFLQNSDIPKKIVELLK
ncbi:alkaline phosphatase [Pedobacter rhodius]|uniref:Alkaline phosphatase n=1 Tax=Pedobacter rhodius TaxID=3004098 RepID=A0ABT4KZZ6_9SPHI|nr:alkaline phosphatase [Pedobacter sp. SJ11]MCZ4224505.1 alkaline phosphatase [Pedobacter sp. SJ11]